ncbi:MAG: ABC transporter ATP-binding protein [Kiritimatiellae bacterium]|nr:ABC transporter ATP-binding protein [Kiritimatiellia bacterium]MCO6400573.1 ABC transporter ATP-binding protein [Verrucomicrobiota bacterium]
MEAEYLLEARHLSKRFARSLRAAMIYGLADVFQTTFIPRRFRSAHYATRLADAERGGAALPELPKLRPTEFWALRDVSFQLKRGDCVGLVGANGAGKSTLFALLSGIYGPSSGAVEVRGSLQALIALGAGFHPMLTGRENIYINASVLGLRDVEIARRLDAIIEFSELGEFVDAPVRTYSSGMLVRLGFSVAAHLDPEILLIDEVLAVGDSRFQIKCQTHTRKLIESGKGIMLVSHYMHNIQGMCTSALWLDKGQVMQQGDVYEVCSAYQRHLFKSGALTAGREKESSGGFSAYVEEIAITDMDGIALECIDAEQPIKIRVTIVSSLPFECGRVYIACSVAEGSQGVFSVSMLEDGGGIDIKAGRNVVNAVLPAPHLRSGFYRFYAAMRSEDGVAGLANGLLTRPIEVVNHSLVETGLQNRYPRVSGVTGGVVKIPYRWEVDAGIGRE